MNLRFTAVVIVVLLVGAPPLESIGARAQQSACQRACSAASGGNDSVLNTLQQQGTNLCNCRCSGTNGGGILHAAANGNCGHCFYLLTINPGGCGCNARDSAGNTPLHLAAGVCNIPITNRAITGGCDVNARNNAGDTPLCRAARFNSSSCGAVVQDLLAAGADPCIECADGQTPCGGCVFTNTCNVLMARGACNCPP